MLRFIVQSLRMPLNTEKKRKSGILNPFDNSIRRFPDDPKPTPRSLYGLFVAGVHAEFGFADRLGRERLGVESHRMPIRRRATCAIASGIAAALALLDRVSPIEIRQKLDHAPA